MSTERITKHEDGQWYFHVRGNQRVGPFDSLEAAEKALASYRRIWSGWAELQWPKNWRIKRDPAR